MALSSLSMALHGVLPFVDMFFRVHYVHSG